MIFLNLRVRQTVVIQYLVEFVQALMYIFTHTF